MPNNCDTGSGCCDQPVRAMSKLIFPDGSQVGVVGLNEIYAAMCAEGSQASEATGEEIINRLKATNFIPSSDLGRKEYSDVLLKEYKRYCRDEHGERRPDGTVPKLSGP